EERDEGMGWMVGGAEAAAGGERELAALAEIAGELRDLPSNDFKERLKTELQRRGAMTTSTSTLAGAGARAGARTITPFLIHEKASALVDFFKATFRAAELKREARGGGNRVHSEGAP